MATDRIQLQALRSKDVLSGSTANLEVAKYFDGVSSPKLPIGDQLEFGEIALNIAKGYEVIAIKNYDGEVVYLPFNVASKLLVQETSLNDLKEYAYESINELSGYTISSFADVNVFIAELNQKIDSEVENAVTNLNDKINKLSADTFTTISATTKQLHEEIKEALSGGTIIDEIIEERLNFKINYLSATTISLINSLSSTTDNKISQTNESLSEKINELSGFTVNKTNELDEKITHLSGSSNVRFNILEDKFDRVISSFSADTQEKLIKIVNDFNVSFSDLSGKTENEIKEIYDVLYEETGELENYVNYVISGLSADTNTKLILLNEYLSAKIDAVSAATESTIGKAILDKINELSAKTTQDKIELENSITDLSANTAVEFYLVSSSTKNQIDSLSANTDVKLSQLKSTLEEEIWRATSGSSGNIGYIVEKIYQKINEVSGDSVVRDESILNRINTLSAITSAEITQIGITIDELVSYVLEADDSLNNKINQLSANTNSRIEQVYDYIASNTDEIVNLTLSASSAYTNSQVDAINGKIDELSKYASGSTLDLVNQIVKVSEKVDKTNSTLGAFSSETQNQIARLDGMIEEAVTGVANLSAETKNVESRSKAFASGYTDTQIESAKTEIYSALNESVDNAKAFASGYTNEQVANLSAETKNVESSLNYKIDVLSAETDSRFSNIKLQDLSNVDIVDNQNDGIEVLRKSGDTWTNSVIGKATYDTEGLVRIGSGLTVDDGVVNVIPIEIDKTISSASTNAIANKAVFEEFEKVNENLQAIDGKIDDVEKEYEYLDDKFNILSASTDDKLSGFSNTISAFTLEVRSEMSENALVQAAALAKQNFELGFNENAEFQPESEKLQGRSVTGALDYLDEKVTTYEGDCQQKYNDLEEKVIDDEKTHAGFASKINYSLGFDKNARYVPETPFLQNRSVTEAIDLVYAKVEEDIETTVISAKTEINNNVNEKIDAFSAETTETLSGFADYLYSEETMHFERSITYENLVKLVRQSKLRWGMLYRLTNYQATVDSGLVVASTRLPLVDSGQNTNNGFDIILRATSNNTLNENARLIQSVNSDYFEDCNLESWEIKYSLFNDHTRFEWAKENGFGVIYYMKDNYGNEAPYDFKNIVFGENKVYTFNSEDVIRDASMTGEAKGNVIKPCYDSTNRICLNNVLFRCESAIGNTLLNNTQNISLGGTQINNIISNLKNDSYITSSTCKFHGFEMA